VAIRKLAPEADGLLFPLVALLNGMGYVFIARLDPDLADNQATWTLVGITAFVATLVVVRRARDLERYRYTFLFIGLVLLVLPLVPGWASPSTRCAHLGAARADQLPAGRVRQDRVRAVLRQLPGGEARAALHGHVAEVPARSCPTSSTSARCCSPGAWRSW
jgi:hypothetical protein